MPRKTMEQFKDEEEAISQAWERFNAAQAKVEAEIRRPAKKINVMSNEEYGRIKTAKDMTQALLHAYFYASRGRDKLIREDLDDFLRQTVPAETDYAHVLDRVTNAVTVFCLALSDPYCNGAPGLVPNYGLEPGKENFNLVPSSARNSAVASRIYPEIVERVLRVRAEGYTRKALKAARGEVCCRPSLHSGAYTDKAQVSLADYMDGVIREAANSMQPSPDKMMLERLIDGPTFQAFAAAVMDICVTRTTRTHAFGAGVARAMALSREGAGPNPDDLNQLYSEARGIPGLSCADDVHPSRPEIRRPVDKNDRHSFGSK